MGKRKIPRRGRGDPTYEFRKLLAELSNLSEWQPAEPESSEQLRERLIAYLRNVILDAEAELTRLGRSERLDKR